MNEYLNIFFVILRRDLTLAFRNKSEFINPLMFFVIIIILFPLAFGSDSALLKQLTSGIIWISALLATCLSLEAIFRSDFEDGSIEQLTLARYPLTLLVSAKVTAHWLTFGLPLIIVALLTGLVLSVPSQTMLALLITLLLGTPVLSLIGAITVALTIGLRGGMLLSLLILPLYMPVLIFSMLAVQNATVGQSIAAEIYFLSGILVLAITLAPITTAAALRIRLS
ncbi:MAG TPA: heme exporter protein CcmB [Thiotrichaceae bacterium]|jgi:heme exporter protein B|nr:heme exporter protein CcmB [Thiotrichaceae bacterium]HIM07868.1 heme exporter protein CcmB [Gammaproteobacteria bacterium]